MARANKYTSLNFNDIYEKKTSSNSSTSGRPHSSSSSSSSSSSLRSPNKTIISNSRIHGHMLVLSRPTPKPISIPQPQPLPIQQQQPKLQSTPDQTRAESDSISLRPKGRTGSGPAPLSSSPVNPPSPLQSPLPKSNRFVPPHLRPGFVGREEKPVPDNGKGGVGPGQGQGVRGRTEIGPGQHHQGSSPNRYGENGRPKSGGGYERMRRGFGEADPVNFINRPGSSGARPSSSG